MTFTIIDRITYTTGQSVVLHGSAAEHAGKTGTIVETYNDRGMDINITLYRVQFTDGSDFWTNESEMRHAE